MSKISKKKLARSACNEQRIIELQESRKVMMRKDGANRLVALGDSGLISHLKLMEEEVKMRIIDTQLALTCLPIKLISFCQFIS